MGRGRCQPEQLMTSSQGAGPIQHAEPGTPTGGQKSSWRSTTISAGLKSAIVRLSGRAAPLDDDADVKLVATDTAIPGISVATLRSFEWREGGAVDVVERAEGSVSNPQHEQHWAL